MPTSADGLAWTRFCGVNNPEKDGCVEVAERGDEVYVRNSTNPDSGMLTFTRKEIENFVEGWPNRA